MFPLRPPQRPPPIAPFARLVPCPLCATPISSEAHACPGCGHPMSWTLQWLLPTVCLFVLLAALLYAVSFFVQLANADRVPTVRIQGLR